MFRSPSSSLARTKRHLTRPFSSTPSSHNLNLMQTSSLFTQTQLTVREGIQSLCARFPNSYWQHHDQTETDPASFHAALARDGWLGIALPESLGGSGLGISEATVMMQTIAESGAGMAGAQAVHANVYATQPLMRFGSAQQTRDIIPRIVKGEWRTCFGVTEPNAGLDTLRLSTMARRKAGGLAGSGSESESGSDVIAEGQGEEQLEEKQDNYHYRITGQKIWITCAQVARKMMLLARTTPREECPKPSLGLSLFCIDLDRSQPGLAIRKINKMGGRAVDANEVYFDDYAVPADALVGHEGHGFKMILHGMNAERCLLAGEALGLGYAALERAAGYAAQRTVFGRPIGVNQGIAHPLADAWMRLEGAKLATYHAARLFDDAAAEKKKKNNKEEEGTGSSIRADEVGVACNSAKYMAAEAAFAACERAVLTHGGMGYATEYDVERWFRESLVPRIAPVSREMILNYISEKVLQLPRSY